MHTAWISSYLSTDWCFKLFLSDLEPFWCNFCFSLDFSTMFSANENPLIWTWKSIIHCNVWNRFTSSNTPWHFSAWVFVCRCGSSHWWILPSLQLLVLQVVWKISRRHHWYIPDRLLTVSWSNPGYSPAASTFHAHVWGIQIVCLLVCCSSICLVFASFCVQCTHPRNTGHCSRPYSILVDSQLLAPPVVYSLFEAKVSQRKHGQYLLLNNKTCLLSNKFLFICCLMF